MEDKLKLIVSTSTYECPNCGKTVQAREDFNLANHSIKYHAKCSNCDYEINTEREATMNEVRKQAGLEPIKECKADELLNKSEPKPDIPMCREVHAVLEERIKLVDKPCGFCGSLMEYKDVKFGEDLNHIVVLYKCPVCGRYGENHRELYNYGVEVLENGDIVPREEEDKQAEESEADIKYMHKVNEIMRENEKLIESNRKLCERISELQDKLDNLQHSLQPSKEECKCCGDIDLDYKAEYHRLLGQSRGLIKEINHYRRIVCELVHLI